MRMTAAMLDHGLDRPAFTSDDGCVVVTLPGPAGDMDRIRISAERAAEFMPPSAEGKLNERQRQMAAMLIRGEDLTSRVCEERFGVTRDTANRDFKMLIAVGIAEARGSGRARHYVYKGAD